MKSRGSIPPICASIVVAAGLWLVPIASAQQSSVDTYAGEGGVVQERVAEPPAAEAAERAEVGVLPFTGFDLWLLAGGALLLIGVGATIARLMPRPSSSSR